MDIGLIVTIVSYVLFFLIILISFISGYKRGAKKTIVNFVISLTMIIIAFLATPPISNAILNITVNAGGTPKPLSQIIVDYLSNISFVKTILDTSPSAISLIENLPVMVVNIAVFSILFLIMRLISYIIYKIIQAICFKKKDKIKSTSKKDKLFGGALGLVKAFVFIFLGLAPVTALAGFYNDLSTETKSAYSSSSIAEVVNTSEQTNQGGLKTSQEILESAPPALTEGINAYNNSILGKVGSLFGLNDFVFDELIKIDIDNESIYLRKDILQYVTVYNTYVELDRAIQNNNPQSIKNIDWERLDPLMDEILDSGLIKGVGVNLIGDFINNYEKFNFIDFGEYTVLLDTYKESIKDKDIKEYIVNDLKKLYSSVSLLGKEGFLDELLFDSTKTAFGKINDFVVGKNKQTISAVISNILDMNLIKDGFPTILDIAITKIENKILDFKDCSTQVLSWNRFKEQTVNIINDIIDLKTLTSFSEILKEPLQILNVNADEMDTLFNKFGNILDKINNIGVLTDNDENKVLDKLFINLGLPNITHVQGEAITTYKGLLNYLKVPFSNIVSLDIYNALKDDDKYLKIFENFTDRLVLDYNSNIDNRYSTFLEEVLLPIYKNDAMREKFLPLLTNIINQIGFIDLDALNVYEGENYIFEKSFDNWKSDLEYLSGLFTEFKITQIGSEPNKTNLFDALIKNKESFSSILNKIPSEKISNIVSPIFYSKSLTNLVNQLFSIIEESLKNLVSDDTLSIKVTTGTFIEGDVEDQAGEIISILEKFIKMLPESGSINSLNDLSYSQIGSLLNAMKENAYRTYLTADKSNEGILKEAFEKFYAKLKNEYPEIIDIIGYKQPYEIDYEKLLGIVEDIKNATEGSFIKTLGDLIKQENFEVTDISNLIDTITNETTSEEKQLINDLLDTINEFDTSITIPGNTAEEIANNEDQIRDALNNNTYLDEETKNKIKDMFGMTN